VFFENNRLNAKKLPVSLIICQRESSGKTVGGKCSRKIVHDCVIVAIAYEQDRKLSEHINQEAPCPSLCQVGATEISIGQNHVLGAMGAQLG